MQHESSCLTGAGISAESGVPVFRGRPASGGSFGQRIWRRRKLSGGSRSSCGSGTDGAGNRLRRRNRTPATWRSRGWRARRPGVTLLTQNVDGLHQRAGSERPLELHGNLWRVRCADGCGFAVSDKRNRSATNGDFRCACGAWLRPDVVWFGESLDSDVLERGDDSGRGSRRRAGRRDVRGRLSGRGPAADGATAEGKDRRGQRYCDATQWGGWTRCFAARQRDAARSWSGRCEGACRRRIGRAKSSRARVSARWATTSWSRCLVPACARADALAVAQDVLVAARRAAGLTRMGVDELLRVPGVGASRAARLLAAVELGRRAVMQRGGERPQLSTPDAVGRYLLPLYGGHREERFGVVMLDSKNRLIRAELIVGRHARRQHCASARGLSRGHCRLGVVDCGVSQSSVRRSASER